MTWPGVLARIQQAKDALAALLGKRYAVTVQIVDRVATVFMLAFLTKVAGAGLDVHTVVTWSYWQTAIGAGFAAALVVIQGVITTFITGQPTLLSPVSQTLRSFRERPPGRPRHNISIKEPRP